GELAAEVKEGSTEALELTSAVVSSEQQGVSIAATLESGIERVLLGDGAAHDRRAGKGSAREALVALLLEHGLSHRAVERVLRTLSESRPGRGKPGTQSGLAARVRAARKEVETATA